MQIIFRTHIVIVTISKPKINQACLTMYMTTSISIHSKLNLMLTYFQNSSPTLNHISIPQFSDLTVYNSLYPIHLSGETQAVKT